MTEEERWLRRLAEGDPQAFWPLWEKYKPILRSLCLRWFDGHPEDAEDALHEAMLKAWDHLSDHTAQIHNLRGWLTQLTRNVCAGLREKEKIRERYRKDWADLELGEGPVGGTDDGPEALLVRREVQTHLLHLIDGLPPSLRQPFCLYVLDEKSYLEIAENLNLSPQTLRKRVQRARQRLQEGLQAFFGEPVRISWRSLGSLELLGMDPGANQAELEGFLDRTLREIRWQVAEVRMVSITLPSGITMDYSLLLDRPRRQVRIETLRKYVQRYPRGWKKRLELAHLLYATGQWEEAIAQYRQVLAKQPNQLDVWLRLGEALRLQGNFEEAGAVYEAALPYVRQEATQHHFQGWRELCRRRFDAAVREFEQAAELEPCNAAHWHALGEVHRQAGRPTECLQAFDEALKLDPDDLVALTRSHNALTALGRLPEAIRRLERVVELDPNYVDALKMLAAHRSACGFLWDDEGEKTHQLICQALRLAPNAADVWETLAHFHVRRGEWEKARAVLQEFVDQHPNNPWGWFHYAVWHHHTGHPEAAAEGILTALRLYPEEYYFYWCACIALPEADRGEDLERIVGEMLARFPERWDTYINAAESLGRGLGQWERACELSRQALARQPKSPTVWSRHGALLVQAGRWEEAIAALEQAWALLTEDSRPGAWAGVALWLGRSYRGLGDESQARKWFEEVVPHAQKDIAFDPMDGYWYLGQALEALGDFPEAIQAYQSALEHHLWYPLNREVEAALERLRRAAS